MNYLSFSSVSGDSKNTVVHSSLSSSINLLPGESPGVKSPMDKYNHKVTLYALSGTLVCIPGLRGIKYLYRTNVLIRIRTPDGRYISGFKCSGETPLQTITETMFDVCSGTISGFGLSSLAYNMIEEKMSFMEAFKEGFSTVGSKVYENATESTIYSNVFTNSDKSNNEKRE